MSVKVIVFDAYGTLFDVHSAVARFGEELGDRADLVSQLWRRKQLEYTWTTSLTGRWRDFRDLTEAALDWAVAATGDLPPTLRTQLLYAYDTLELFPDVEPALTRLRATGARLAILSNGSASMLARLLRQSGVADSFDAVLSVDAVRVFKPDPRVYGLVTQTFGAMPKEVLFVSSNRWDVAGARAFGFGTVWLRRDGQPDEYIDLPPDRVASDLHDLTA